MTDSNDKTRFERFVDGAFAVQGSLFLSLLLIFFDAVFSGGVLLSYMVCPIWFLIALFRAIVGRASFGVATARVLIPIVTVLVVSGAFIIQDITAMANATRIIRACERYRHDNGAYPKKLADLVPRYMSTIPSAKYCLFANDFIYASFDQHTMLMWLKAPPYGRRAYDFERGTW